MCHDRELITEQTMVTHHGHTIAEHGQTWSAINNHDTMVKLLSGFALYRSTHWALIRPCRSIENGLEALGFFQKRLFWHEDLVPLHLFKFMFSHIPFKNIIRFICE